MNQRERHEIEGREQRHGATLGHDPEKWEPVSDRIAHQAGRWLCHHPVQTESPCPRTSPPAPSRWSRRPSARSRTSSVEDARQAARPRRRRAGRYPRSARAAARRQGARRVPLPARHAGVLDRSGEPLPQAEVRRGQEASCSSAPAACARRWRRRRRSTWG